MKTWILLLRGVNVGGRNVMPMQDLVELLEEHGCSNIRTYIQSGNVVLCTTERSAAILKNKIEDAIRSRFSLNPSVLLLSEEQLASAAAANPFPAGTAEPATLHFFFLSELPANFDESLLEALRGPNERFALVGKVFYLLAPDGIGRSKLAANVEKRLGVATTARNYRTVDKLLQLVSEAPAS